MSDDIRFLRRLAADKRKEANHAKTDIGRNLAEDEADRLQLIADKLQRYELLAEMLNWAMSEGSK